MVNQGTTQLARTVDNVPNSLLRGSSDTHVYLGARNGNIDYVGITKNPTQRIAQHGDRFSNVNVITSEPLTRRQARAIEQAMINRNPQYSNKINSISPNRDWYQEAVDWGEAWLQLHGY